MTENVNIAPGLDVRVTPLLTDNYAYLLRDQGSGRVAAVDPGEAAGVLAATTALGWELDWILLTHHHGDHIDGVDALRAQTGAKVVGAAQDAARLPALDVALGVGETWSLGAQPVHVIDTPGHTVGHVAYHLPEARAAFVGDTLFALGCGRMFEGTALQMWGALSALAALPADTQAYAGHEYTEANARFAISIEPESAALQARCAEVAALRAAGAPTLPTTIGRERETNPFLRAAEASVKVAVGLPEADDAAVFAELRRRKDSA